MPPTGRTHPTSERGVAHTCTCTYLNRPGFGAPEPRAAAAVAPAGCRVWKSTRLSGLQVLLLLRLLRLLLRLLRLLLLLWLLYRWLRLLSGRVRFLIDRAQQRNRAIRGLGSRARAWDTF